MKQEKAIFKHTKAFGQDEDATHELRTVKKLQGKSQILTSRFILSTWGERMKDETSTLNKKKDAEPSSLNYADL